MAMVRADEDDEDDEDAGSEYRFLDEAGVAAAAAAAGAAGEAAVGEKSDALTADALVADADDDDEAAVASAAAGVLSICETPSNFFAVETADTVVEAAAAGVFKS